MHWFQHEGGNQLTKLSAVEFRQASRGNRRYRLQ